MSESIAQNIENNEAVEPAEKIIEIQGIHKIYGSGNTEVRALDGVDFTIEAGQFVSVMGPSGSGKSTCMNIIGCLDVPTSGGYLFCGLDVARFDKNQLALLLRNYLGFVFQSFNLIARTTAMENVELPLIYQGIKPAERRARALHALDSVGIADRANHAPSEFSGGQQQRVAIARALVSEPTLLLADEPTGNLDSETTADVLHLLQQLNHERDLAIVMVTHEPEVAVHTRRVLYFVDGKLVDDGFRSFLTALGIIIGVGSVIAMVHVGQAATQSVTDSISSMGSNLLTVSPARSRQGPGGVRTSSDPFPMENVDIIAQEVPGILIAPEISTTQSVV